MFSFDGAWTQMYDELKDKYALVTGGTRGFGRAIALRLAKEGVFVVVNYRRSKTEAYEVVDQIAQSGGRAIAIRADVGNGDSLDALFREIDQRFGRLDIVVANAAFGVPGALLDSTDRHWDVTMAASARSLLDLSKRAVPLMSHGWGRIISITSEGAQRVLPGYGIVGAAKGALEALTRSLAVELAPQGIRVNGVLAGLSDTKSFRAIPGAEDAIREAEKRTPVGRTVLPEDVANVVAFLASNEASMICGQFITVDGGRAVLG